MRVGRLIGSCLVVSMSLFACGDQSPLSPKSKQVKKLKKRCSLLEQRCSILRQNAARINRKAMQIRARWILDRADLEQQLYESKVSRENAKREAQVWAENSQNLMISCRVANRVRGAVPDALERLIDSF